MRTVTAFKTTYLITHIAKMVHKPLVARRDHPVLETPMAQKIPKAQNIRKNQKIPKAQNIRKDQKIPKALNILKDQKTLAILAIQAMEVVIIVDRIVKEIQTVVIIAGLGKGMPLIVILAVLGTKVATLSGQLELTSAIQKQYMSQATSKMIGTKKSELSLRLNLVGSMPWTNFVAKTVSKFGQCDAD
jgi:hypothetical protein